MRRAETVTIRSSLRVPAVLLCAFLTVFGGAYVVVGNGLARAVGIVVIVFGIAAVSAAFRERLTISDDAVVFEGLIRARRLPRDQVKSARLAHQGAVFWRLVVVDDRDRTYTLGGVGALALRQNVAEVSAAARGAALINSRDH